MAVAIRVAGITGDIEDEDAAAFVELLTEALLEIGVDVIAIEMARPEGCGDPTCPNCGDGPVTDAPRPAHVLDVGYPFEL